MNFNQSSYDIVEGDDAVLILLLLSQPSLIPLQVEINTMDITTSGILCKIHNNIIVIACMYIYIMYVALEDYVGGTGTITIQAGETVQPFTLNVTDDKIVECSESLNVVITSVTGSGVTIGNINNTEVIIVDNDGK